VHRGGSVDSTDHPDANVVAPVKPPKSNAAAQVHNQPFTPCPQMS